MPRADTTQTADPDDTTPPGLRPTRRVKRRRAAAIPTVFTPEFWADQDGRTHAARTVRDMVDRLKADAGADSYQKEILVQRAVFVALQLETAEIAAARDGSFDAGVYTQQVNSLLGLLKALGLEKKARKVGVKDYLAGASA